MQFDVIDRYNLLVQSQPALSLYALVDGLQYEAFTQKRIEIQNGINRALFYGPQDAPLAHAGPWLYDMRVAQDQLPTLIELEQAKPAVSWLITTLDLEGLALLLQLRLDAEMPDGKKALVRFYDPRVLLNMYDVMTEEQKAEFFSHIDEWHFLHQGKRVWTGRTHA